MFDDSILYGEEGFDTDTGRSVWWDGQGWSPARPRLALEARPRPALIPLSFAQTRLWFLHQLNPGSAEYNIAQAMRLRGPLQVDALRFAVNAIVRRHESLRTRFVEVDGVPRQVVEAERIVELSIVNDLGLGDAQRYEAISKAAKQASGEPFDLEAGPLLRVSLLVLSDEDHMLLITMHHIVSDGWSSAILSRELTALYDAFCESRPDPLPPLAVQYADFTLWQRESLEAGGLATGLEYWKAQLVNLPARMELPTDHPRGALQTFAGGLCVGTLNAQKVETLKRMTQSSHATLYMSLLAVFALVLERHTGQTDIVVGTPIANRLDAQLEDLIGFFVNSLVMRVRVDPSLTFRQLLAEVQKTTLDAYEHQNIPFERLVAELSPERGLNLTPLFQVVFALQNAPFLPQSLKGLTIEPVGVEETKARFDLDVHVVEDGSGLTIYWLYNRDLFDGWRMETMLHQYMRLIEMVALAPNALLSQLDVLSKSERTRLLETFHPVRREIRAATIPQLFEEQVERTSERIALICGHERICYGELNARANRLAHRLIKLGVGPHSFVGVCLERSAHMVVALLAVLKAGAAYLPLDPAYPEARLTAMLEDAKPLFVLGTTDLAERLGTESQVIAMDDPEVRRAIAQEADRNPNDGDRTTLLLPQHPAYIIYTSGSTGVPKGVVVEHRSMVTLAAWAGDLYTKEEWAGVLASTSICFDPSTFELLLTPIHGGKIILARTALDLEHLPAREEVALINTVPSAAQALLALGVVPATVCTINLFGEKLPGALVRELYALPGMKRVYNLYGPTEDTTYSTAALCPRDLTGDPDIGRPLWNTRTYVLDARLRPAPVGVEGDLYLAGDGLAEGYWNRPSLTAERFPADPHGEPGARMYRTGDRARWTTDGRLEFLGRSDHQVKIRGFRVEPGEVEQRLSEQPGVAQEVVIACDAPSGRQLVAYVVPVPGRTLDPAELRRSLADHLPDYMVPSVIVISDALPRTPNGKLDRALLPAPYRAGEGNSVGSLPGSAMQHMVTRIWAEVLGSERIGLYDNFFDIGGDSLSLIKVLSRLRKQVSPEIKVVDLFRYSRVSTLAGYLEQFQGPRNERAAKGKTPSDRAQKQKEAMQRLVAARASSKHEDGRAKL